MKLNLNINFNPAADLEKVNHQIAMIGHAVAELKRLGIVEEKPTDLTMFGIPNVAKAVSRDVGPFEALYLSSRNLKRMLVPAEYSLDRESFAKGKLEEMGIGTVSESVGTLDSVESEPEPAPAPENVDEEGII